jgi:peptidyl-prolyl cis-trans isomerase D
MLQGLRQGAGSWFARGLMFLLVLSFAAWGIGDYLVAPRDNTVAAVGSIKISADTYANELRRDLQAMQIRTGTSIDMSQARALGLADQALAVMIDRALLEQAAEGLGVRISDQLIKDEITASPAFKGLTGEFDRFRFDAMLRNEGLSEAGFIARFRRDLARRQLVDSLITGVKQAPAAEVDALFRHRAERRVAEYFVVANATLESLPDPNAEELAAFHKDNPDRFSAPESRALSWVVLTPADVAADVKVDDQEVRDEYEARRASYRVPERRAIEQAVYPDEAAARAAHKRIKAGESLEKVAAATLKLKPADLALGKLSREQLPEGLANPVFGLAVNAVSEPLQSALGWHIVRVTAVEPAQTRAFENVRDELRREIAMRHAADSLVKVKDRLDDQLAGGATLEEAAASLKIKVQQVAAVDAQGRGPDGKPAAGLPRLARFLNVAFAASEGGDLAAHEAENDAFFVVRVDRVTPAALRPLDSIRAQVVAAWKQGAASTAAANRAALMADRAKAGTKIADLAASVGAKVETSEPLTRGGRAKLSPSLVAALFRLKAGEAAAGPSADGNGHVVARLARIDAPDAAAQAAERARVVESVHRGLAEDIYAQYRARLEADIGVKLNRAAIDAAF